jgi:hypothetical protein
MGAHIYIYINIYLYGTTSPFSSSRVPFITDVGKARKHARSIKGELSVKKKKRKRGEGNKT